MVITSRKNPAVMFFRELCRDAKAREESGLLCAEGVKLCMDAVRSQLEIKNAFVTDSAKEKYPEEFSALSQKADVQLVSDDIGEYMSDTRTPQGFFVIMEKPPESFETDKKEKARYIILDRLQDSGNVGTVIRTCDALGMDGVILSEDCADVYSPKTVRSTMGSLFRVPVMKTALAEIIPRMKKQGFCVFCAMLDSTAKSIEEISFPPRSAVVIGNEGSGVSAQTAQLSDGSVYIPIESAQSLNAAVAAAIVCWELRRDIKDN